MKKKFIWKGAVVICLGALFLYGLFLSEFFISKVAVHNVLVEKSDAVVKAEEVFFDAYWVLADNADVKPITEAYSKFKFAADDLDKFFTKTRFAKSQQNYLAAYNADYKPFITDYIAYVGRFIEVVNVQGFVFVDAQSYFKKLDQYTIDFVDVHNKLTKVLNSEIKN